MAFTRPRAAQIDFDVTNISDPLIRLNSGQTGTPTKDVGLVIERGDSTNVAIIYDESADQFVAINTTEDGSTSGNVTVSSYADLKVGQLETTGELVVGGNLTVQGTTVSVDVTSINITNSFSFEGATPDGFETTLTVADPTADRTITLPDVTGYAAILQSDPGTTLITATVAELNYVDGVTSNIQTQIDNISSSFTLAADSGTNDTFTTGQTLTIAGGTGIDTTVSDNNISIAIDSTVATLTGTQTLTNKTITSPTISNPTLTGTYTFTSDATSTPAMTLTANSLNDGVGALRIDGSQADIFLNPSTATHTTITFAVNDDQRLAFGMDNNSDFYITRRTSSTWYDDTFVLDRDTGLLSLGYGATVAGTLTYSTLNDGTTTLTSTVAELNYVDGVTSNIQTQIDAKTNNTGTVTSVAGTGTVNGLTLSGTVTSSGSLTLGGTFSATVSEISDLTATAAELNVLDGIPGTLTATELGYVDGVTSAIQTQLDAKLALAGGTMSGAIAMGTNKITGMGDPTANQDAATKAYVDTQTSSIVTTTDIAGDSGTDTVTLGSDTLTFSGTANEITTAVTNNTVTISLPDDITIGSDLTVTGNLTVNGTTTTISTTNSVVSDSLIELNTGATSNANDLGIVMERGSTGDNAIFAWDESADAFVMGTTTATGESTGDLTITNGELRLDTLRIDQSGAGLRMTNVGAFDNDGSDNFRIFATNDLQLKANGDSGGGLSIDVTNNDVTIDNDLRVSAGQFYYGGTAVTSTAAELNILDGVTSTATELNLLDGVTGTLVTEAGTQTLTNKTLTNPTINAFSGTGNGSITGTLSIVTTTTDDSLLITTTEDSSSAAPVLTLKRNSSSVADADYLGQIKFKGENDADQEVIYAKITAKILDATDGTEDGIIEIAHKKAGSNNISARFRSDSLQLINGTQLTVDGTSTFNGITVNASQTINMGSNRITSVADPVGNQDAATKAYVDSQVSSVPTGDITAVNITAGTGLSGTVSTASGDHTQTLSIDSTVATLTGSQTLTNKTLTAPVIGTISNTGTLTLPTSTGTVALTSDIPTNNNQLTNGAGYITGYTVTESDVTTHQAALSITESQISDLGAYATLASPTLTGTPAAPTATAGTNTTQIATTAFVSTAVANIVDSAPAALDTLNELAAALGDDANFATTTATSLGEKLVKASNLSDLTDAATARTNLGLGTAATTASTAYATAAQGSTADSATQPGDNVSTLTNDSGYITASTTDTLTNKTLTSPQVNTNIDLLAQADLRFYDSDDSNYVGFQAPATATGNILWTLPGSDGTEGQVLSTNGGGTLAWEDPGSGGGSGSSYPNSTFSTVPGTNGDFDLSYNVGQTTQETPFETGGTDAFGVNLGSVFSLMDPIGSIESIDYGDSEAYVGA